MPYPTGSSDDADRTLRRFIAAPDELSARDLLQRLAEATRAAADASGAEYSEPYSPPAVFGHGLGYVLWVKWKDAERAHWLSIVVKAAGRSVTLTLKETRGPFTTFRREVALTTIDEALLTEAWLWLCGHLRFATPQEEEENARRSPQMG